MTTESPWLNHGGTTPDNPVLDGMAMNLILHKQGSGETLRKVWVVADNAVFYNLTPLASVDEFEITVPIVAGTHLKADSTPVENVIHFTTSSHRHAKATVYCASRPTVMITLDGYDASDWERPLIYPLYDPDQGAV